VAIQEGFWDCSYCGSSRNRGIERECPNCGKPRGDGVKFYRTGDSRVLSEKEARGISRNPDWLCEHCDSLNGDRLDTCSSCGRPREESDPDYFSMHRPKKIDLGERESRELPKKPSEDIDRFERKTRDRPTEPGDILQRFGAIFLKKSVLIGCLAVVVVGLLVWGLVALLTPTELYTEIVDKEWTRIIDIEENTLVHDSGWSLPINHESYYTTWEIHHWDQVLDHYETVTRYRTEFHTEYQTETRTRDLGNGFFETETVQVPHTVSEQVPYTEQEPVYRNEPVYQTKYYYTQWRYLYARSVVTAGHSDEPYWGEVILGELERGGRAQEKYIIFVEYKDKRLSCDLAYDVWNQLEVGSQHSFEVYAGNILKFIE